MEEESVVRGKVVRKDTVDHRQIIDGQFLISNKDRGTTVTPSRPRTGTEVQVQNTQEQSVQDTRNNQLFHREKIKTKKLGLVPPNGGMTTARGSFAFFWSTISHQSILTLC